MRLAVAALVIAAVALSLIFYAQLPDVMPIHWNAKGQIDGYAPKLEAVAVVPVAMLVVLGVFALLALIAPPGRAYHLILFAILAFLLAVHALVLFAALHRR